MYSRLMALHIDIGTRLCGFRAYCDQFLRVHSIAKGGDNFECYLHLRKERNDYSTSLLLGSVSHSYSINALLAVLSSLCPYFLTLYFILYTVF